MAIIPNRKIWYIFSGTLIVLALVALGFWGLRPGIDFTGGSLLEIKAPHEVATETVHGIFGEAGVATPDVQRIEGGTLVLRFAAIDEATHQKLLENLKAKLAGVEEVRFDSVGPTVGQELFRRALIAVVLVTLMILGYIAWSFRHVSRPVPAWVYAVIVILVFMHDVIIPLGLFAYLGNFKHWEIGSSFIAAVLTILGYSISDTIVVLDRVRENIRRLRGSFEEIVESSVHQTIVRSMNTSFTTLLALIAIFLFGGETLQSFALALIVGIITGTYSSIFIAAPLLVTWYKRKK